MGKGSVMLREIVEAKTKFKVGQEIKMAGDKIPFILNKFIVFGEEDGEKYEKWKTDKNFTAMLRISNDKEINAIEWIK